MIAWVGILATCGTALLPACAPALAEGGEASARVELIIADTPAPTLSTSDVQNAQGGLSIAPVETKPRVTEVVAIPIFADPTIIPKKQEEQAQARTTSALAPSAHTCVRGEHCYWETPMDISNPDAVWQMLIQPMIVVDGHQRGTVSLYSQPSAASPVIGEVTCYSQGVHLLEILDNGWSRIECYTDIYNGRKKVDWCQLVQGYIQTELLTEVQVRTKYGIVVDKLTQRMYVFENGRLLDPLLVSTGLSTERAPEQETNSGEFLLASAVGTFVTENENFCRMSIRFNRGDMIHEVPYTLTEGKKAYRSFEAKLGQRASEGCIRVQRNRTPSGMNMYWLWGKLRDEMETRIVIWEDVKGRSIPIPDASTPLFISLKDKNSYHSSPDCRALRDWHKPIYPITYGELGTLEMLSLSACTYCNPPLRVEQIQKINREYQ